MVELGAAGAAGVVAIPTGRVVEGTLRVPPSKSVSNRYLMLALMVDVPVRIGDLLEADDTAFFLRAVEALGRQVERGPGGDVQIGRQSELASDDPVSIDCGAGGTMLRFLTAALTVLPGRFRLDGSPRLRQRPVGALVACLRSLGAHIDYLENDGYAPLLIEGSTLVGGGAELDAGESSQYLSAVLMAATRAQEPVEVRVRALTSCPYLAITADALAAFGARVEAPAEDVLRVTPVDLAPRRPLVVEGDYSAAAYPAVAALLSGGRVRLKGLREDSPQGDRRFFDLLQDAGARVEWYDGAVEVSGRPGRAPVADLGDVPDQVPTLAALAPFLDGTTEIRNVGHLRIKESDRLAATATELTRLGVPVDERADGLVIEGCWHDASPPGAPVRVETYDDHRIAMSMALVGLRRPGVTIGDPGVVSKSYPNFWRDLGTLLG
ncbi:MAG: 3-phosphoshikimate 1-carboxyvinyltransferase [Acidobacteriota bacterium]|nr:3-phosphoshikimate 1-carboxyvinyltransferase [Acidobacteriota bacterium]